MKIGDYVRNKYGIAQIIDIENKNGIDILVFDKKICFLVNKKTGEIKDNNLFNRLAIIDGIDIKKIKLSSNIIDLIEVGDYVNGRKIDFIGEDGLYSDYNNADYYYYAKEDIESIVTKEQFENIEYRIGK